MRSLGVIAVLVPLVVACRSEEGALLVLHGDAGSATKLEIVLASPTVSLQVVQRHLGENPAELEDVRYYKQLSTSGPITEVDAIEDFRIRLEPNLAPEDFVPFVLAYAVDANGEDTLVAVGRIHAGDADQTPRSIQIPEGRLDRYDIQLEPIALPVGGIEPNHGTLVHCARTTELRGAVWRFEAGIQLRLILPLIGELSAMDRAFDLDCDESDVETENDCDDLQIGFNPQVVEAGCSSPDFNCDGQSVSLQGCSLGGGCEGNAACDDPNVCVPSTLTPECRCFANECIQGVCQLDFRQAENGSGQVAPCQPAIAVIPGLCPPEVAPCDLKILNVSSATWLVEVGKPVAQSLPEFHNAIRLEADETLLLRVSHAQGPGATMVATPNQQLTEIDIEYKNQTQVVTKRFLINLLLSGAGVDTCPTFSYPDGTVSNVNRMQCFSAMML
ncbi:MAG: hypothetical protein H0T79_21490 [Deltaproteobacteria bacterium]|nr:hypothetical protein [Deltaproteobacteria bacterium]